MEECPFCEIARGEARNRTSSVLFQDDKMLAFEDLYPAGFKHYLVVPVQHVRNVNSLRGAEDYALVEQMLKLGVSLLQRDAPTARRFRYGFHRPPFNSVDHLHLHCIALPYKSWWRAIKYTSLGCLGGWIGAETVLARLDKTRTHSVV